MTKTLRIEVTPAMREAATAAIYAHDLLHGIVDKTLADASNAIKAHYGEMATAALTAAFQDPEFVRQIREQVGACVDETPIHYIAGVSYINEEAARASLGRLLGEEGK